MWNLLTNFGDEKALPYMEIPVSVEIQSGVEVRVLMNIKIISEAANVFFLNDKSLNCWNRCYFNNHLKVFDSLFSVIQKEAMPFQVFFV